MKILYDGIGANETGVLPDDFCILYISCLDEIFRC